MVVIKMQTGFCRMMVKSRKDHFGKVGATLKVKFSETELKVGDLLPMSPVLVF